MSTIIIPDEILKEAHLDERGALIEFACRLFEAERITFWSAAKLAKLDRAGMEEALLQRNIPLYRTQPQDLTEDLETLHRLGI